MSSEPTRRVVGLLRRAQQEDRDRRRTLDAIARGDLKLTPDEREQLTLLEREVKTLTADLGNHARPVSRVVSIEEETGSGSGDRLPQVLVDRYALLVHQAYGSDPAIRIGDPVIIRGLGKVSPRTSTNQPEGIDGHGVAGRGKRRPGASKRSIIKDRRSYELKARVDRRLRGIAKEIGQHLSDEETSDRKINSCTRCGRIGEDGWGFCPYCGHGMERRED